MFYGKQIIKGDASFNSLYGNNIICLRSINLFFFQQDLPSLKQLHSSGDVNFVFFGKITSNIHSKVNIRLGSSCFAYVTKLVASESSLSQFIRKHAPFLSDVSLRLGNFSAVREFSENHVLQNPHFSQAITHLLEKSDFYFHDILYYYKSLPEVEELVIQPISSTLTQFILMDSPLKTLRISNNCFHDIHVFMIANLLYLSTLQIGRRCCCSKENNQCCCIITNCPELSSISIGSSSFTRSQGFHLSGLFF